MLKRIYKKIGRLRFTYFNRHSLKKLGKDSFFENPYRVDGGDRIEVGVKTVLQRGGWLYCQGIEGVSPLFKIGSGCVFGYNNHFTCVRDVVIGDHVLTANNVYISDNLHEYEDITVPIIQQPVRFKRNVVIGSGSWIGENVSIIGAHIGKNCVIGANSVVTRDIPDYCVAVGVPAVIIKQYDLKQSRWIIKK
jgi:acetyltransferase-like isoleucine patch superfamily enzyme